MKNEILLPSKREEKRVQDEKNAKDFNELKTSLMREDFGRTFQTEHGLRVLAWIRERCGHNLPPLAVDKDGNISEKFTTHNAMELSFYLAVRKYIPVETLKRVEYNEIKPSGYFDPEDQPKRKSKSKKKGK